MRPNVKQKWHREEIFWGWRKYAHMQTYICRCICNRRRMHYRETRSCKLQVQGGLRGTALSLRQKDVSTVLWLQSWHSDLHSDLFPGIAHWHGRDMDTMCSEAQQLKPKLENMSPLQIRTAAPRFTLSSDLVGMLQLLQVTIQVFRFSMFLQDVTSTSRSSQMFTCGAIGRFVSWDQWYLQVSQPSRQTTFSSFLFYPNVSNTSVEGTQLGSSHAGFGQG